MNKFLKFLKPKVATPPLVHQSYWYRVKHEVATDWIFILALSTICSIVLIIMGVSLYINVNDTLTHKFTPDLFQKRPLINQKDLSDAIERFDTRAVSRDSVLGATSTVKVSIPSDPSL